MPLADRPESAGTAVGYDDLVPACLEDQQVAALAEGSAPAADRAHWLGHTEGCQRCREVVAAAIRAHRDRSGGGRPLANGTGGAPTELARRSLGETEPARPAALRAQLGAGDAIGRYRITRVLGAGGMGVVYEARDPELDRLLAIKLLRDGASGADTGLTARLVREAKALAALAHPNVVAIHDVGEHAGCPFLAMEYIRGTTLREWLPAEPRTWREIARMFEQIARGLAAAHAAGLVHRDVKPDNVMVGIDGRARVTDFGLVRPTRSEDEPRGDGTAPGPVHLTQTGAVMGTPAYMSPEQHVGEPGDARSDQFSFCVALYEAVYGKRPFAGNSWAELATAVIDGRAEPPPSGVRAPRWLRRLIDRGLARERADRHPDMAMIADQLAAGVARRRSLVIAGIAGIAIVAAVTVFAVAALDRGASGPNCGGAEAYLHGVWDEPRKIELAHSMLGTQRPYAHNAFASASEALDRYTTAWTTMRTDACRATHERGEQSQALLDLRMACLDRRLGELGALVDQLRTGGAETIDKAVQAVEALTSVASCADVAALTAIVALPADPSLRARVAAARTTLATVKALSDTGRYPKGLEAIAPLVASSAAIGYAPLDGEVHYRLGVLQEHTGDITRAIESFQHSAVQAEAGHDDPTKAQALIAAARVMGTDRSGYAEADHLLAQARATVTRIGGDAELESRIENALALIRISQTDYSGSLEHSKAALELARKAYGADDYRTAREQLNVADALEKLARYDEATNAARGANIILVRALGAEHPVVLHSRGTIGDLLFDRARYDDALREYTAELDGLRRVYGGANPQEIPARDGIGQVAEAKHDYAAALAAYQAELALVVERSGVDHVEAARVTLNIGNALFGLERYREAVEHYNRAKAIAEKAIGHENPIVAGALNGIAAAAIAQHDARNALPLLREELRMYKALEGEDHRDVAMALDAIGHAELELHRDRDAIAPLEDSLRIFTAAAGEGHPDTVTTRMRLGTALWQSGADRTRGRALLVQARDQFHNLGERVNERALDTWLREHR
jgi:tetratricopeptide (TPR) repeat protein